MKVKVFYPFTLLRRHFADLEDIEVSLKKLEPFYYFKRYEKDGVYCFEAKLMDSFVKDIYLEVKSGLVVKLFLEFDSSVLDSEDLEVLKEKVLRMVKVKDYDVVFDGYSVKCAYRHSVEDKEVIDKAFELFEIFEKQTVEVLKQKGVYNMSKEVKQ